MSKKLVPAILFCASLAAVAAGTAYLYSLNAPSGKAMQENNAPANSNLAGDPPCIITIDGLRYDVTSLRSFHSGGDIFQCGTDMSAIFHAQHGGNLDMIKPYLVK